MLYIMGKSQSNLCQWFNYLEDVELIMNCSKYNSERETLRNTVHETGQECLKSQLSTGQVSGKSRFI